MKRLAIFTLVALTMGLAACGSAAQSTPTTHHEPASAAPTTAAATTAPEPTTPPSTTTAFDPAVETFVSECSNHVSFKLQVDDTAYAATWGHLDPPGIEVECRRIATAEPARVDAMRVEIVQLREFFAAAEAAETPTPAPPAPPPPPPTPVGPPPSIQIDCGPRESGNYEWIHLTFGYSFNSREPIVEWGMDYGDGKSFVAHDEAKARQEVYWHKYHSPGLYFARAWIVDSFGRRGEDMCAFSWFDLPNGSGSPSYNDDDDYYSGDLDCEDIGHEVYIDDEDPNNLDADGDGIGCEGW